MSFRDMAYDGGYRGDDLDRVAAQLEEEERERLAGQDFERGIVEKCTCGSTEPDQDGQRDQILNPNCMTCAPADTHLCAEIGHEWEPAGGGLLICGVCEAERWVD